jgi:peptide-methionine (S)-S-oxide reductase
MPLRLWTITGAFSLTLLLAGPARAQESTTAKSETPDSASTKAQTKDSDRTSPESPGDRDSASQSTSASKPKSERATFGAGCFWHVEDTFERLRGVNWAVSGYAGGSVPNPTYEMVHEGLTGHAEVVMVEFDPSVISYEKLLNVFWKSHDPTSINRQGPDVGPQYRSVIFYHNEEQKKAALESYRQLTKARVFRSQIVTQLMPLQAFYRAEDYHQDYYGGKPRAVKARRKTTVAKAKKTPAKASRLSTAAKKAAAEPPSDESSDAAPGPQP